jgi:hypothetical protein
MENTPNNNDKEAKSPKKESKLITAVNFAEIKGFNNVDKFAISKKYKKEMKTAEEWSKILRDKFKFKP